MEPIKLENVSLAEIFKNSCFEYVTIKCVTSFATEKNHWINDLDVKRRNQNDFFQWQNLLHI
jgi:hypothetical protein